MDCLEAALSQFAKEARPYLYTDECNRPTADHRRFKFNPSFSDEAHSIRPGIGPGNESMESGHTITVLHFLFIICPLGSCRLNLAKLFINFRTAGTDTFLDLSLFWRASEDQLKRR